MGQAKQKAQSLAAWKQTLSADECVIADVAERAHKRIIVPLEATGMCYRMAFFLTAYLKAQHNIDVEPIVGFVNDGESDVMASHAWVEFSGKRTDISLTLTEHPTRVPTGSLLILDREYSRGRAFYSYHRERDLAALQALDAVGSDTSYAPAIRRKEAEHAAMLEISRSRRLILPYLNGAPDGRGYEALATMIRV